VFQLRRLKNVGPDGKVINPYKPVLDEYGSPIQSNNTTITGYVIDPSEPVLDDDIVDDTDDDFGFERVETGEFDRKIILFILCTPGIGVVLLTWIFDFLTPLMRLLFIPSLAGVLFLTFFLPNLKQVINQQKLFHLEQRYWNLLFLNIILSFVILYPIISPPLFEIIDGIGRYMINKGATDGFWSNLWALLFISALYYLCFALMMFVIPLLQWLLWKFAGGIFCSSFMQSLAQRLTINKH
jgi:hypothetical protein